MYFSLVYGVSCSQSYTLLTVRDVTGNLNRSMISRFDQASSNSNDKPFEDCWLMAVSTQKVVRFGAVKFHWTAASAKMDMHANSSSLKMDVL